MNEILDREFQTYDAHKQELLATAQGRYVLIHNNQIIGIFDTESDAITRGYQMLENVPFLVKQVLSIEPVVNFATNLIGV